MKFQSFKKGEDVFKQGDEGRLFYIVFDGVVEVYIPVISEQELTERQLAELVSEKEKDLSSNYNNGH